MNQRDNQLRISFFSHSLMVLFLLAGLAFASLAYGQNRKEPGFYIHGGVSASTIQNAPVSGFNKINMFGGLGYFAPIDADWAWTFEGNVVQKGTRRLPEGPAIMVNQYLANLMYGQVAGMINYRLSDEFSVFLGPAIGILLSSREEDFNGEITGPSATDYRTIEVSAVGGVRFHIGDHINIALRFDQSILPIINTGLANNNIRGVRQYNTVAGVGVAYVF